MTLSTLRDERETALKFNSPLDSSCRKEHTSNIQEAKLIISLIWGFTIGGLLCLEHRHLQVECELTSWQSDLSPLKCMVDVKYN